MRYNSFTPPSRSQKLKIYPRHEPFFYVTLRTEQRTRAAKTLTCLAAREPADAAVSCSRTQFHQEVNKELGPRWHILWRTDHDAEIQTTTAPCLAPLLSFVVSPVPGG